MSVRIFMIAFFLVLVTLPFTTKLFAYRLPPRADNVAMDNATSGRMGSAIWQAQKDFRIKDSWGH